ncbi:uncharacterized protein LOC101784472 isoform X6 [Setaria italica]|uniref:uncharacterized protein LOC101784472 isoform X6 n=1 Tax=Setaria italica TaxID=4555 RepID=UPI000BE5668C|nr:uncharacterized protein LOC101784472 isoform X6 [Setaria italica]
MEEELLPLHQIHHISPEFAGGLSEDVANELLYHLVHLFLVGDQGEGHPQTSSSSSPSTSGMNLARSTPTPPYTNKQPLVHALIVTDNDVLECCVLGAPISSRFPCERWPVATSIPPKLAKWMDGGGRSKLVQVVSYGLYS